MTADQFLYSFLTVFALLTAMCVWNIVRVYKRDKEEKEKIETERQKTRDNAIFLKKYKWGWIYLSPEYKWGVHYTISTWMENLNDRKYYWRRQKDVWDAAEMFGYNLKECYTECQIEWLLQDVEKMSKKSV